MKSTEPIFESGVKETGQFAQAICVDKVIPAYPILNECIQYTCTVYVVKHLRIS